MIYFNIILLLNLVSMTYSCINVIWKLNKGSTTADEQPPYD